MYFLIILLLMFIFPSASVLAETFVFHSMVGLVPLIGKWFVFWAVGVRLFTAGFRQASNPRFTAEEILGLRGDEPLILVQELGFANLSMGVLGMSALLNGDWIMPGAIVGCLFIGLAGIRHIFSKERNLLETGAMLSNLVICIVLFIYITLTLTLQA